MFFERVNKIERKWDELNGGNISKSGFEGSFLGDCDCFEVSEVRVKRINFLFRL